MRSELHLLDRLDEIESRLDRWTEFFRRCGISAPFCSPVTWVSWLRTHPSKSPAVFEWQVDGELRALVPMVRSEHTLEMAASLDLDYQDLAATSHEEAVEALLAIVARESSLSSRLIFPQVAAGSRLAGVLADPRVSAVAVGESRYFSQCPVAEFSLEGKADFLAAIPARQRKDYRNASRRISEHYPEHVVQHLGPGGFDPELIEEIAVLHRANQFRKSGESVFAKAEFVAFLKELAAGDSALCLSILREHKDGPLIAFHLGYSEGDTFYYYITSYSGAHSHCAPGRWLLVDALRHRAELLSGTRFRFDMLSGEEGYKFHWATGAYLVSRFVLLPRRLDNLPRILAYSAVYGLKKAKNRLLHGRSSTEPEDLALPR